MRGSSSQAMSASAFIANAKASRPATVESTTASSTGRHAFNGSGFKFSPPSSRGTLQEAVDLFDEVEVAEEKAMSFEIAGLMSGVRKSLLSGEIKDADDDTEDDINPKEVATATDRSVMDEVQTAVSKRMQVIISGDDELLMQQILEDSEDSISCVESPALF